jgi:MFS family permease
MTSILELLRSNPPARRFFLAWLQSSLGNGMGYVALVLVALDRFHSPWAVALVLIADLVPLMALGPLLGGLSDRLPRRACAVGADLLRAIAFTGIALVHDMGATLALAALAGAGNGLFNPAALAGLPHLAGEEHAAAGTSLFSAISTLGKTVGPVVAAALLLGGGVELALLVNGASFLVSALLLASIDLGGERTPAAAPGDPGEPEPAPPAFSARALPGFMRIVAGSSGAALFAGMANVAEPGFITHDLNAAAAGFSVMVGLYGVGVAAGSLAGSRGGDTSRLWLRYLAGILGIGAGYAAAALAPVYALALPGFVLAGLGNGLLIVHERLLVQAIVPERAQGRAFGTLDMFASWAFAAALGCGALAAAAAGSRTALLLAGTGTLAVWAACTLSAAPLRARAATRGL